MEREMKLMIFLPLIAIVVVTVLYGALVGGL